MKEKESIITSFSAALLGLAVLCCSIVNIRQTKKIDECLTAIESLQTTNEEVEQPIEEVVTEEVIEEVITDEAIEEEVPTEEVESTEEVEETEVIE